MPVVATTPLVPRVKIEEGTGRYVSILNGTNPNNRIVGRPCFSPIERLFDSALHLLVQYPPPPPPDL